MNGKTDQRSEPRLRVNLRQLEVFVATARGGSTRAAADRIARSQSAASTALADLEASLGAALFDRVGRRLVLNENGRAMLPRAASLLDQASELQHLFSGEHATPLRVAASLTIGEVLLPELVAKWKLAHPASPVQLIIGNTSEVIEAVVGFDVDVGFIEGPQTHPDLIVRPWLSDQMVIVAAPGHPLAQVRGSVGVRQLREAPWALREHGSGTREAADRWLTEHLGELKVEFELGSPEAIKRLVAAGTALGCLSRHAVAQALAQGLLVELRTRLPPAVRRLAMVLHRDKRLGRGTENFVRHCAAVQGAAKAAR
ncbi:MAG: LysR family transcriptional regulator [Methylibium sp.]|uniref:LysR family transcriptional regulator n=1 Tax=Methylibium sp. TaxID=2067992 RepID=UPI00185E6E7F|nr:LysR family transcriptional regulator [Methylibium sp.]MBA3597059.1 LysR family transcriptional regulator [Methylibium sp.]